MNLGQTSSRLSGQTAQMNPGSGHGMPQQQQQQPQVASGSTGGDPQFVLMRKANFQRIVNFLAKLKNLSTIPPNLVQYAKRLEVVMCLTYPTKADYCAMMKGPLSGPLNHAIKIIMAEGQRRQQQSGPVASGSSYGTMIPTPGMPQSATGNSVGSHLMDTTFTGGNSTTGSMYNGHQNPSTNIPLNSTTSGNSVGTTSEGMQRLSHMIPTPGFSNKQTLLANFEYSSGPGCLNVESNIASQMQQQEKPLDSNPMQHLGSLAVPRVHPDMLDKSSSYGSSDAKMNGGMGIYRSNMQLINRTTGSKACVNLSPYGSPCKTPLQQQFNAPPPQKSPSTSNHHMNAEVLTPQDKGQQYICQRKMVQDRGHQPVSSDRRIVVCTVTSLDSNLSNISTKEDKHDSGNINDEYQLRWLLMLHHAEHCRAPTGSCKSQYCVRVQEIVKHFRRCQTKKLFISVLHAVKEVVLSL